MRPVSYTYPHSADRGRSRPPKDDTSGCTGRAGRKVGSLPGPLGKAVPRGEGGQPRMIGPLPRGKRGRVPADKAAAEAGGRRLL